VRVRVIESLLYPILLTVCINTKRKEEKKSTEAERGQTHFLKMLACFLKILTHFLKILSHFLKILTCFLKILDFYFNILILTHMMIKLLKKIITVFISTY